jgi:hypothetical protein
VSITSESWFDKVEPWLDRLLKCLEVMVVLVLAFAILVATGFEIIWVFRGDQWPSQGRLATLLKGLNENWKVVFLLLVPLFYRTVRGFLERVEEFAGAKAPRSPKSASPEKPNPPELPQHEGNPAAHSKDETEQRQ